MDQQSIEQTRVETGRLLETPAYPAREERPALELLLSSVRLHGVLCPVLVRPVALDGGRHGYQVVCGYRRVLAAREAGLETVPVVVARLSDGEAIRCYLSENTCRQELSDAHREEVLKQLKRLRDAEPAGSEVDAPGDPVAPSAGIDRSHGHDPAAGRLPLVGSAATRLTPPAVPPADPSAGLSERWGSSDTGAQPADASDWHEKAGAILLAARGLLDTVRESRIVDVERALGLATRIQELPPRAVRASDLDLAAESAGGRAGSWLARHSVHVALLNRAVVEVRGDRRSAHIAALAGLLHDIGMVFLERREYLFGAGALTPGQQSEVRSHTRLGYALLSHLDRSLRDVAFAARDHHERRDGSGYPAGLAGHDISWLAQLTGLTDSFVAMTASRPYRDGMREEEALERLQGSEEERAGYDPLWLRDLGRLWAPGEQPRQPSDAVSRRLAAISQSAVAPVPADLY